MNPDAIIITGDLTENGVLDEFESVKEQLKKIKNKNVVVLSETMITEILVIYYSGVSFPQKSYTNLTTL